MRFLAGAAAAAILLVPATALAETLRVASELYPDLQSAVTAASAGEVILVDAVTLTSGAALFEKSNLRIRGLPGATLENSGISVLDSDRITIEGMDAVLTKNVSEGANYGFALGFPPITLVANVAEGSNFADVFSTYSESQFVLIRNRFETFIWDFVIEFPI